MTGPAILVTGGAGYIGSHACKALARGGYRPVVLDDLSSGHADAVKWGPLVRGRIADRGLLREVISEHRIAAVMHFAALAYVGESVASPADYYRTNVAGSIGLLDACLEAGVAKVVFSSSCATYGIAEALPLREGAPMRPESPYGRSKLMVEQILTDHAAAYGLAFVALRYFNAAGADPDGELAERHVPETHLIPCALMAAAGNLPVLQVFGTEHPTRDGTCVRDYVHVTDLAEAHVRALDRLLGGGGCLIANLGTGFGTSVREIIRAVERVTGRRVPVEARPSRPGDPPELFADPTLARKELGFDPKHSDLETIVATAARTFGLEAGRGELAAV